MTIASILQSAVSGLNVSAARVGAIAENVVNVNTPGFKQKEVRSTTLTTDRGSNGSFSPGGVQANVVIEDGPVELTTQFTRLIQARTAFSASTELIRTADELQRETVNIKA